MSFKLISEENEIAAFKFCGASDNFEITGTFVVEVLLYEMSGNSQY